MSLRHESPTFVLQRATPVIVGWFAGRTWGKSVTPNRLNYCVMCIVCTEFTHVAAGSRPMPLERNVCFESLKGGCCGSMHGRKKQEVTGWWKKLHTLGTLYN